MSMNQDIQKICKEVEKIDKHDFRGLLVQIKEMNKLKGVDRVLFAKTATAERKDNKFFGFAQKVAPILLGGIKGLSREKMREFLEVLKKWEQHNEVM